jgi:hypothetical protein
MDNSKCNQCKHDKTALNSLHPICDYCENASLFESISKSLIEPIEEFKEFGFTENNKKLNFEKYKFLDMFDSVKRKEIYDYFDSNYKVTDEEKEIFNEWKNKR